MRYKEILVPVVLLGLLLVTGTLGYHFIEGASYLISAYMTVITLATVGYKEAMPLSQVGMIFTMGLILVGVGLLGYTFTRMASFVIEGDLRRILRGRRMEKAISRMKNHIVVCGFGRVGKDVADFLKSNGESVVVIDREMRTDLDQHVYLVGDATEDAVLLDSGIARAKALVACLSSDADNVFLTLSAKTLSPEIRIVSRAISGDSVGKLRRAGADEVISIHELSARRMASVLIRPHFVNLVDIMSSTTELVLEVSEIKIEKNPGLTNMTISEMNLKRKTGALILAVRGSSGQVVFNPDSDYRMKPDDELIIMGEREQIQRVAQNYD